MRRPRPRCSRHRCNRPWQYRAILDLASGDQVTRDLCTVHMQLLLDTLPTDGSATALNFMHRRDVKALEALSRRGTSSAVTEDNG